MKMDNQTRKEVYERLNLAFGLDDKISLEELKNLYNAEKLLTKKDPEKIAEDFKELCSALENKMTEYNNSFNDESKEKNTEILWDEDCENNESHKKIGKADRKNSKINISELQEYKPITAQNSIYYQCLYLKTVMKYYVNDYVYDENAVETDLNTLIDEHNIDYWLSPLYKLVEFLSDLRKKQLIYKSKLHTIQYCIRNVVRSIVRSVIIKEETITDEILEEFQIYTQIMLYIFMQEQKRSVLNKNDIPYAISFINHCLAYAFYLIDSGNTLMVLEFAKKGLNLFDPRFRQDAFLILGSLAGNIDYQLAYDAYYSWINSNIVGEIANQKLYTITPAFDSDDSRWRKSKLSQRRESVMHNNLACVCGRIGDSFELGSKERKDFYKIAKEEITIAIRMRNKSKNPVLAGFYINHGAFLSASTAPTIPQPSTFDRVIKKYDNSLKTSRDNNSSYDLVNAIYHCELAIMDLLSFSFHRYKGSTERSSLIFDDWMKENEQTILQNISRLKELSAEYKNIMLNFGTGINSKKAEALKKTYKQYLKIQDLIEMLDCFSSEKDALRIVLLLIILRRTTWHLRNRLCRLEYSPKVYYTRKDENEEVASRDTKNIIIAYYTTLHTAKFLFDELYMGNDDLYPRKPEKKEKGKGKNCLTVVHAKYMNDPYEGLALLEAFESISKSKVLFPANSITCLRDEIYNDTFVFLKSFTDQTDSLIMWNRYASDRSDKAKGNDSNGCCIQFDPEMFNNIIYSKTTYNKLDNEKHAKKGDDNTANNPEDTKKTLTSDVNDDYHLYRMVYLAKDGTINEEKNPGLMDAVKQLYNNLKNVIIPELGCAIDAYFGMHTDDKFLKEIKDSIRQSLQFMIFLFKSDDYADENESRLIFLREFDQQDTLTLLPTDPAKLAVNPYEQIYIKRIIFGPNVRDNEEWEPFFQYSLNKMWKKYEEETGDASVPLYERYSIEKSSIHYHN